VYYRDPEFYRQRHREKVEELRADYQRAQARSEPRASAHVARWARSVWSARRSPAHAPAFRA
jgi:hypothetical protein